MKKWLLRLLAIPVLVAGCTDEIDNNKEGSDIPQIVEVTILTEDKLPVGEKVKLAAQVKQGDEYVEDAEEVKLEVWESGLREDGVMLDGVLTKDGIYEVEYNFNHDGVYYIFAHTTARGMHVMPKKELIIGSPDMSKVLEDNSSNSMDDVEENNHSGH